MNVERIQLTVIGSSAVSLRAAPAALVAGGVQIEKVSFEGTVLEDRLILSLTAAEAREFVAQIEAVVGR